MGQPFFGPTFFCVSNRFRTETLTAGPAHRDAFSSRNDSAYVAINTVAQQHDSTRNIPASAASSGWASNAPHSEHEYTQIRTQIHRPEIHGQIHTQTHGPQIHGQVHGQVPGQVQGQVQGQSFYGGWGRERAGSGQGATVKASQPFDRPFGAAHQQVHNNASSWDPRFTGQLSDSLPADKLPAHTLAADTLAADTLAADARGSAGSFAGASGYASSSYDPLLSAARRAAAARGLHGPGEPSDWDKAHFKRERADALSQRLRALGVDDSAIGNAWGAPSHAPAAAAAPLPEPQRQPSSSFQQSSSSFQQPSSSFQHSSSTSWLLEGAGSAAVARASAVASAAASLAASHDRRAPSSDAALRYLHRWDDQDRNNNQDRNNQDRNNNRDWNNQDRYRGYWGSGAASAAQRGGGVFAGPASLAASCAAPIERRPSVGADLRALRARQAARSHADAHLVSDVDTYMHAHVSREATATPARHGARSASADQTGSLVFGEFLRSQAQLPGVDFAELSGLRSGLRSGVGGAGVYGRGLGSERWWQRDEEEELWGASPPSLREAGELLSFPSQRPISARAPSKVRSSSSRFRPCTQHVEKLCLSLMISRHCYEYWIANRLRMGRLSCEDSVRKHGVAG